MIIRDAQSDDLASLAQAHASAFEGFYLTRLGPDFLQEYYRTVLEYDAGILLIASTSGGPTLDGFVAGFMNSPTFYRRLRSRRLRLARALLPRLVRTPSLLMRVFQSSDRVHRESYGSGAGQDCELASLGVLPTAQGKGIGKSLVHAFLTRSRKLGADRVLLTTDSEGNDSVKRFYQSMGFRLGEPYQAERGRWMHRCEYAFSNATDHFVRHEVA